ncbi:hypothetical protein C2E23DRAFT_916962 [Lenzites betulinus]|nr:hypothetical protein C2E23DRAFT_916962 [Lenzites betulinus]
MRYAASLTALTLASVALAQDVTIHVGSDANGAQALAFTPANVTASAGSVITFVFDGIPGNHTVAQSAFAKPCEPLAGGFDSGYIAVPATTDKTASFPTFNLTVTDASKPIWFYCAQQNPAPHCLAGMVGSINAPATGNTFDAFVSAAKAAASVVPPSPALSGVGALATAAPGPLVSGFSGAAVPTGTLPAAASGSAASGSGSASGSATGSGSGTGAPAATGSNNAASATLSMSGFVAFVAAAFGVALV